MQRRRFCGGGTGFPCWEAGWACVVSGRLRNEKRRAPSRDEFRVACRMRLARTHMMCMPLRPVAHWRPSNAPEQGARLSGSVQPSPWAAPQARGLARSARNRAHAVSNGRRAGCVAPRYSRLASLGSYLVFAFWTFGHTSQPSLPARGPGLTRAEYDDPFRTFVKVPGERYIDGRRAAAHRGGEGGGGCTRPDASPPPGPGQLGAPAIAVPGAASGRQLQAYRRVDVAGMQYAAYTHIARARVANFRAVGGPELVQTNNTHPN